ncbi:mechanosensitive ion channel domain-containing protein [Luteolibacter marinus]|uniref:mechanosensitive ion channel domain-containing protein n=1 Tax=Luteolibacter marinus TaxID=2776705 RepID=UPI0018678967
MIPRILALLLLGLWLAPLHAQDEAKEATDEPAALVVWQREIIVFRASIANLTPTIRRDMTLQRMVDLPDFSLYQPVTRQDVALADLRGVAFSVAGRSLFTLVEGDLDPTSGQSLDESATEILGRLEELRRAKLEQRNWTVILRGAGIALAATLIFAAILWGLSRLNHQIRRFFIRRTAKLRQLKQRDLDLRPAFLQTSRRFTSLVIAVVGMIAAYVWLTVVLAQFPYTAPWAGVLGEQVALLANTLLNSIFAAIPNLLIVTVIFFVTRGTARLADQILRSFERSADTDQFFARDTARATRRIATVLIWIVGLVVAYPYIPGSDSEAFKGISVLVGLMISLGSTGLINQVMSGFVVLYSGAVRTGEYARVGDVEGIVTDIGLLSTKVRTPKDEFVTVPNSVLISKDTVNYSRNTDEHRTRLATSVTIGYDAPWKQVRDLLLLAADRTPGIRDVPEPRVVQTALSDFYAEYELRFVPADITRKGAVLSDLHERIQDAFHEAGVQIMSPNFVAQPDQPVLPPKEAT